MGRINIEVVGRASASVDADDQWKGVDGSRADSWDVRYSCGCCAVGKSKAEGGELS